MAKIIVNGFEMDEPVKHRYESGEEAMVGDRVVCDDDPSSGYPGMQGVITALVDTVPYGELWHDIETICRFHTLPVEDNNMGWSGAWKLVERWGNEWGHVWFMESDELADKNNVHRYVTGESPREGDVVRVQRDTLIPAGSEGEVVTVILPTRKTTRGAPFHPLWCPELMTQCVALYECLGPETPLRLPARMLELVRREGIGP